MKGAGLECMGFLFDIKAGVLSLIRSTSRRGRVFTKFQIPVDEPNQQYKLTSEDKEKVTLVDR